MIFTRPAGAVMIFTRSRNAAASDNSMYCMIPDPFPSLAFGKGSATPDYMTSTILILSLLLYFIYIQFAHYSYSLYLKFFLLLPNIIIMTSLLFMQY